MTRDNDRKTISEKFNVIGKNNDKIFDQINQLDTVLKLKFLSDKQHIQNNDQ